MHGRMENGKEYVWDKRKGAFFERNADGSMGNTPISQALLYNSAALASIVGIATSDVKEIGESPKTSPSMSPITDKGFSSATEFADYLITQTNESEVINNANSTAKCNRWWN